MVIALQETWKLDYAKDMPGYNFFFSRTCTKKNGGGVEFLIRNNLNFTIEPSPFIEGILNLLPSHVLFTEGNQEFVTSTTPQGGTNKEFLNQIKALNMSKDVDNIICGDFNIDALKPENTDVKMTFAELGLGQLSRVPPYLTKFSAPTVSFQASYWRQIYQTTLQLAFFMTKFSNIGKQFKPELHQCITPNHFTI
jgi:hypothetical protein